MLVMEPISPKEFEARFRSVIRVGINWSRFINECWPISILRVVDRESLGVSVLPWYLGDTGQEVPYSANAAYPVVLDQIPEVICTLNRNRQKSIGEYAQHFSGKPLVELAAPSFDLGNGRQLILDGNHRLSALFITKTPFVVTFYSVQGPKEPNCLPDLIHWGA
jgi:hypothetical protein